MPFYLKITTVNCRGIRDRAKRLAFSRMLEHLRFTFCVFKKPSPSPKMSLFGKMIVGGGDKNQAVFNSNAEISWKTDAGTAILLNHPSLQFGNIRKDSGGRILTAEIRCDNFVFQLINVYAFTSS